MRKAVLASFTLGLTLVFSSVAMGQDKTERAQKGITKETVYEQNYENGKIKGEQKILSVSTFDATGKLIEETSYDEGKPDKTTTLVYDAEGKKIKEIEKNASGKITRTFEYKYVNGLKSERITYGNDNKIKNKKIYKYEAAR